MTAYLWQLYDAQGRPIQSHGATKHVVVLKGLLHGTVHVWFWRTGKQGIEVMLQKRAGSKLNWPGRYDKSAGGHISFGEQPLDTALRKTHSELGLAIAAEQIQLTGVLPWWSVFDPAQELIENEFQWIFIANLGKQSLSPDEGQVETIFWKPLKSLVQEAHDPATSNQYVPYDDCYFGHLESAITQAAK